MRNCHALEHAFSVREVNSPQTAGRRLRQAGATSSNRRGWSCPLTPKRSRNREDLIYQGSISIRRQPKAAPNPSSVKTLYNKLNAIDHGRRWVVGPTCPGPVVRLLILCSPDFTAALSKFSSEASAGVELLACFRFDSFCLIGRRPLKCDHQVLPRPSRVVPSYARKSCVELCSRLARPQECCSFGFACRRLDRARPRFRRDTRRDYRRRSPICATLIAPYFQSVAIRVSWEPSSADDSCRAVSSRRAAPARRSSIRLRPRGEDIERVGLWGARCLYDTFQVGDKILQYRFVGHGPRRDASITCQAPVALITSAGPSFLRDPARSPDIATRLSSTRPAAERGEGLILFVMNPVTCCSGKLGTSIANR